MKTAWLAGGGDFFAAGFKPQQNDIIIAVDAGYSYLQAMGIQPDCVVGDFDSLGDIPGDVDEIVRVPAKKDETDAQLAVNTAISRGADDIVIIASTDGRFDHTLSLVCILEDLWDKKIPAHIVNGHNRVRFLRDSGVILVREGYKYFSVIALDKRVKRVTVQGGEYPLVKKDILRGFQYAVSNEFEKNCALIEVGRGSVLIIESRDK